MAGYNVVCNVNKTLRLHVDAKPGGFQILSDLNNSEMKSYCRFGRNLRHDSRGSTDG